MIIINNIEFQKKGDTMAWVATIKGEMTSGQSYYDEVELFGQPDEVRNACIEMLKALRVLGCVADALLSNDPDTPSMFGYVALDDVTGEPIVFLRPA